MASVTQAQYEACVNKGVAVGEQQDEAFGDDEDMEWSDKHTAKIARPIEACLARAGADVSSEHSHFLKLFQQYQDEGGDETYAVIHYVADRTYGKKLGGLQMYGGQPDLFKEKR